MEYYLVSIVNSHDAFADEVNKKLQEEYKLHGDPIIQIGSNGIIHFYQALIKV